MSGVTFGSYRVLRKLGEGGMGAVYAAEHVLLGRAAAVKVLLPEHSANQHTVTRFFNEARAATSIRHMGIVEIYDFGYAPDGTAYIAMELLDGESLAARMHRGALTIASTLAIARQIAGALGAAHHAGIVHRDLKPDNVFVVPDAEVPGGERIKLLDFGIAKLVQPEHGHASTNTGAVLGTPTYMAPEQCRGVALDHRADLYALGCMIFEMLSGRPPFSGEGAGDVLAAHIHVPPPSLRSLAPRVPRDVDALVARLLAKDPAARPASARDLIGEIDRLGPIRAETTGADRRAPTSPTAAAMTTLSSAAGARATGGGRRVAIWAAVAGVVVVAGIVAIVIAGGEGKESTGAAVAASGPDAAPAAEPAIDAGAPLDAPAIVDAAPIVDAVASVAPAMIAVSIDSDPPGAQVSLGGKVLGTTPYRGELTAAAPYRFTVHLDDHVDQVVTADGRAPIDADVVLVKKKRTVRSKNPNQSVNPF